MRRGGNNEGCWVWLIEGNKNEALKASNTVIDLVERTTVSLGATAIADRNADRNCCRTREGNVGYCPQLR